MQTMNIAGLKISSITKRQLLDQLAVKLGNHQKTFIITPYSEFLYRALQDKKIMELLNKSDYAVPDGIGIFWAYKFLSLPLNWSFYYGKIFQALWQVMYTGAAILLRPSWVKKVMPEKIPGSDLIWDLAELCAKERKSIFLLGGFDDTPKIVAQKLTARYPELVVTGYSTKAPNDPTLIDEIKNVHPDAIFVAYGPIKQERWIVDNMQDLPAKLYIGLGGTFDYVASKRLSPPRFIRSVGLEWLYRLITQPHRVRRIYQATVGLITSLIRYKVFLNLPYRLNVASVIFNEKGEVFVARFNPYKEVVRILAYPAERFQNYWQFPQGGIEDNEGIEEGAKRELWEETAMRRIDILAISEQVNMYDWPTQGRKIFVKKRYRFRGQKQHVVYMKFNGTEKEISLDKNELVEYKWILLGQLRSQLPYKQALVDIVESDIARGLVKLP